jgi:hypothetical protein
VTRIKLLLIFVVFWFDTFEGTTETYTIFVKFTDKLFFHVCYGQKKQGNLAANLSIRQFDLY